MIMKNRCVLYTGERCLLIPFYELKPLTGYISHGYEIFIHCV